MITKKKTKKRVKVLVACHCEPKKEGYNHDMHSQLTFQTNSNIIIDTIHYIDPDKEMCPPSQIQFNDWNKISDNTYDYIWFERCPIYGVFVNPKYFIQNTTRWNMIITPALKKLKKTGKIYITSGQTPLDTKKYKNIVKKIFTINKTNAKFEIVNYKDFEIHISQKFSNPDEIIGYVITK